MSELSIRIPPAHAAQRDALLERMLTAAADVFDIFSMYLGDRLGFYHALAQQGPVTSTELAARTATHERYAREWLEQQTVAGIVEVEDASIDGLMRRFRLPPGHAEVLTERDSLNYLTPLPSYWWGRLAPLTLCWRPTARGAASRTAPTG